jgi:signal transduction histidine kinase
MAQGRLAAAAACAALLAAGAAAEIAAPGPAGLLTAADYAVGVGFAVTGAWLWAAERGLGLLSLTTAATWFAGTLATVVPGLPGYPADVAVLAYRAVLVHLLMRASGAPRRAGPSRWLIAAGYLAVLLPDPADGLASAAVMTTVAAVTAQTARRAHGDSRVILAATALAAAAISAIWWLTARGAAGAGVQLANDAALLAAAALLAFGADPGARLHGAINALVVELGPSRRPNAPVSTMLAGALADPELEVRYAAPGMGWFSERGDPVDPPPADQGSGSRQVTKAAAPGGGEVALVHSRGIRPDPALAQAAAQAAALVLDSARLSAEVREQAIAVRESRRRLLSVGDAERQALETRLQAGPVGRLQRADETLADLSGDTAANARTQLAIALDDLAHIAQGLFPGQLGLHPIETILREMVNGMPITANLMTSGPLQDLPSAQKALVFFFCSECLANVTRHAKATTATVELHLQASNLVMSVLDNGHGGATVTASRGLRGLADRVEVAGGTLAITSPPGGPTRIRAEFPLA